MDRRKSILNAVSSVACKIILLVGSVILRRLFIKHLGMDKNGLNSLYVSVLGILSVAELGVGSAISFCMYEPIVTGQTERVAALYRLFSRAYRVIGAVILLLGLFVTPFLPLLVKNGEDLNTNIYLTFVIFLLSVVLSYAFNARLSLINAYKNNYISTLIQSGALLFQYAIQCVAVVFTRSYEAYLMCAVISVIIQYFIARLISDKMYGGVIYLNRGALDLQEKKRVKENVRAMLMHKIGGALVNSTDSIIISAIIGIGILGSYTNYAMIAANVTAILSLAFVSLTSVIGHIFAKSRNKAEESFNRFYSANFMVGAVFFLGFYAVSDYLVSFLFSPDFYMGRSVIFIMTLNYFVQFLRQSALTFRDATGTFYMDRYKPLIEGFFNLTLSVALALLLGGIYGEEQGVTGVILATVITNIVICHTVEPYVLFKYAFLKSSLPHIIRNYACILLFTAVLFLESRLLPDYTEGVRGFLISGAVSVFTSLALIFTALIFDKQLRKAFKRK